MDLGSLQEGLYECSGDILKLLLDILTELSLLGDSRQDFTLVGLKVGEEIWGN